jgi:uncharacterized alpha-E superfamily protein
MLSRVAENIYWMSRYIERAENTARLVYLLGKKRNGSHIGSEWTGADRS